MTKRQKWKDKEDQMLRQIIRDGGSDFQWDKISQQMHIMGFRKSPKQCRERWQNQLNPSLSKDQWTRAEYVHLIDLHQQIGCHWKEIASKFRGRTDNSIKNKFFSLIRKALRNAWGLISDKSESSVINQIKPKVLSNFVQETLRVAVKDELGEREVVQNIGEFVKRFAFYNFEAEHVHGGEEL